jgi:hypothetical protein
MSIANYLTSSMPAFGLGCCDRCHRLLFDKPIIFWTADLRVTERVQVFIRRLPLGLDQGNQQHLVSTTLGNPSEARDLVGGP